MYFLKSPIPPISNEKTKNIIYFFELLRWGYHTMKVYHIIVKGQGRNT